MYEKIKKQLDKGAHVTVRDAKVGYCVFSPFKDCDGNYRHSLWSNATEEARQYIGSSPGYPPEDYEDYEDSWEIVDVFYLPFERFKEGEKVYIKEDAKKWCEQAGIFWNKEMEAMLGKVFEIKDWRGNVYGVWSEDKSNWWVFPHQALCYPYKEETDDKTQEAIELLKKNGYKIIKE